MSEVPLYWGRLLNRASAAAAGPEAGLQGYLAHQKRPSRRTLRYDHPYGPMVALGGGGFLLARHPCIPLWSRGGPIPLRCRANRKQLTIFRGL